MMFNSLANYFAQRKLAKLDEGRKKQFLNWKQVERLALILDQSLNPNKSQIDEFVSTLQKYTEVFLVDTAAKHPRYGDWICFTKTDKNILGLPKNKTAAVFGGRKYDTVICISRKKDLFTAGLVMHTNATCKCGNMNVLGETDLIIEKRDDQDLTVYLKEVIRYFEMIKAKQ